MARDKGQNPNIDNSDLTRYPNGRIQDDLGSGNGTPVNEEIYGDIHEMKDRLMRLYGIEYNGLPDNETNGYQLVEALRALASKNDFLLNLTQGIGPNSLSISLRLGRLITNETFFLRSTLDILNHNSITGSDGVSRSISIVGTIIQGDYIRMVNTAGSIVLIKVIDSGNIESVVSDLGFLKGATQAQENAGTSDSVSTTPLVNRSAFERRVIGSASGGFLASQSRNGLMSSADKVRLDNINTAGIGEERRGFINWGDTTTGSVGQQLSNSGQLSTSVITDRPSGGKVVTVTMDPPMPNDAYFVHLIVQSVGGISLDINNNIRPPIYERVNLATFRIFIEDSQSGTKNLRVFFRAILS